MNCKYCGASLSKLSSVCPRCGNLITEEQQKIKKEINGFNNPYINRLNELNKKEYRKENIKDNKIKGVLFIIIVLLIIILIALFISNR